MDLQTALDTINARNLSDNPMSVAELRDLASQVSASTNGSPLLLNSGGIGDGVGNVLDHNNRYEFSSQSIADHVANNSLTKTIRDTDIGKLLNDDIFQDGLRFAVELDDSSFDALYLGIDSSGNRINNTSFWDDASYKLVTEQLQSGGDIIPFVSNAPADSVFAQTETRAILDFQGSSTSNIAGHSFDNWKTEAFSNASGDIDAAQKYLTDGLIYKSNYDNGSIRIWDTGNGFVMDTSGTYLSDTYGMQSSDIPSDAFSLKYSEYFSDVDQSGLMSLASYSGIAKTAAIYGTGALDLFAFGVAADEAYNVWQAGIAQNNEAAGITEATEILSEWAGGFLGGLGSAYAGAKLVALSPVGALAAQGGPFAYGGAVLLGGLAGGFLGGAAVQESVDHFYDLARDFGIIPEELDNGIVYSESVITTTETHTMTFQYSDGSTEDINFNPSDYKIAQYDLRVELFEAQGQVVAQVSGTTEIAGVSYNTVTTTYSLNGEVIRVTENTLPDGVTKPINGLKSQKVIEEVNADGQFFETSSKESIEDPFGNEKQTRQFRDAQDENWVVRQDSLDFEGKLVLGETYVVPSPSLHLSLSLAGGTLGSFYGNKLADGNVYQEVLYSTFLKTVGEQFGTFGAYLVTNDVQKAWNVITNQSPIDESAFANQEFSDQFFKNLNGKLSSLAASVIIDEVGEALDLGGVAGEVVTTVGDAVTVELLSETIDVVFGNLQGTPFAGWADGSFNFDVSIADVVGAYAGGRLANEIVEANNETAALFGELGKAFGAAVGAGKIVLSTSLANAFAAAGTIVPGLGTAIGAFIGVVAGTFFGNAIGGETKPPTAWATVRYDNDDFEYELISSWASSGGDVSIAQSMAQSALSGVNSIIDATYGKIRLGSTPANFQIGYEGSKFIVDYNGTIQEYSSATNAIYDAAFQTLKNSDIVGGHAVVMRAWHNTDATNIHEFREDIEVAEAFQQYLLDPTAILALMMNDPESELAQSWASILKRAAELELHLPHEKDLDGGWDEILLAQGIDIESIPSLEGDTLTIIDPVTGEETLMHHIIGPGYEIVRIEGTDGNDIINVTVDGPSITYVDGGAGDDQITGSDQADILVGAAGDDIIEGLDGNDWLHGGAGNDNIDGGAGDDFVIGAEHDDTLTGGADDDSVYGGAGEDHITDGSGSDYIYGGAGDDVITTTADGEHDHIYGEGGDDTFEVYDKDSLYGGKGNDTFNVYDNAPYSYINVDRDTGHDVVNLNSQSNAVIRFSHSIGLHELFYDRDGDHLKILILGEDQSIQLNNFFKSDVSAHIQVMGGAFALDNSGGAKSTAAKIASYHASLKDQLEGEYNVLNNSSLAQWQNYYSQNYSNFIGNVSEVRNDGAYDVGNNQWVSGSSVMQGLHRKITPWNNYFAGAYSYGSGNDNIQYINDHDWVIKYHIGGAGNDTIRVDSTAFTGTGFHLYGDSGDDYIIGASNKDTIVGGLGNDYLNGFYGDDQMFGGHGDDQIKGHSHDDALYGGAGNDTIWGGAHEDIIYGGDHADVLYGETGNDRIFGEEGADIIEGDEGDDLLFGGEDNDTISGDEGNDRINGERGHDFISGGEGNDVASGGEGEDIIHGHSGDDYISGNQGNDTLNGGSGSDFVEGGEGNDTLIYNYAENIGFDDSYHGGEGNDNLRFYFTAAEYALFENDLADLVIATEALNRSSDPVSTLAFIGLMFSEIEGITVYADDILQQISFEESIGANSDDVLEATAQRDLVLGQEGDDIIRGMAGNDMLLGGDGNDHIETGSGNNTVYGGAGRDVIVIGEGNQKIDGGYGEDTVSYEQSSVAVQVDLSQNTATHTGEDVLESVENVQGSDFIDQIIGNDGNNEIRGGDSRDTLIGGAGNDEIYGEGGSDIIEGNEGRNKLFGGESNDLFYVDQGTNIVDGGEGLDRISYQRHSQGVEVNLDLGEIDKNNDGIIDDRINSIENVNGSNFNDRLLGGEDRNYIVGNSGDDVIYGFAGNDSIIGGNGDDTLFSGAGADWLNGSGGADIFVYEEINAFDGVDQINGFSISGGDRLDISDLVYRFDPQNDDINNFVQTHVQGNYLYISIDVNGTGANYIDIARLRNATNFPDVDTLYQDGVLITELSRPLTVQNEAPVARDDYFDGQEGLDVTGNVLADNSAGQDFDPDGDIISVVAETITTSSGGTVSMLADGSFTYTPLTDFFGEDTFVYQLVDENSAISIGIVHLNITPGINEVEGTSGNDLFYATAAQDVFDGLGGNDRLFYSNEESGVIANLETGEVDQDKNGEIDDQFSNIEMFFAGQGDSEVFGSSSTDKVFGNIGNDIIYGYQGHDILAGGGGNDTLYGGEGNDTLHSDLGDDIIYGDAGNDTIYLKAGNKTIDGGEGADFISLSGHDQAVHVDMTQQTITDQANTLNVNFTNIENVNGSAHDDTIQGDNSNNVINGMNGSDTIRGGDGNDTLHGGTGNDILFGDKGFDRILGNQGADIFVFEEVSAFENRDEIRDFNITQGDQIDIADLLYRFDPQIDNITDFVEIRSDSSSSYLAIDIYGSGSSYIDIAKIVGVTDINDVQALYSSGVLITELSRPRSLPNQLPIAVNDSFSGLEGAVIEGNVLVDNGQGADTDPNGDVLSIVEETITTSQGGVVSILEDGAFTYTPADDFFGADTFDYQLIDDQGGLSLGTVNITIESTANVIHGTESNDVIHGTDQDDEMFGFAGADKFFVYGGENIVDGGLGTDQVSYVSQSQAITANLQTGEVDRDGDGQAEDQVVSIERFIATNYDDDLTGGDLNDKIYGYHGNDTIRGGKGVDYIFGGNGDDIIYGSEGFDRLYGQSGADRFVVEEETAFLGRDIISDFNASQGDVIDLSDILTQYDSTTDNIFNFIRTSTQGNSAIMSVDQDGDGVGYQQVLRVDNNAGMDIEALIQSGNIEVE